jgi:sugar transferase (PEP-CTERM/EpsH1 system associated)
MTMSTLPDILVVAHRVPYPPDKGDRIRVYHLLKYLSRFASVHLACLADEPVPDGALGVLGRICTRVAVASLGSGRWLRGGAALVRGKSISEGVFHSLELVQVLRNWAADTPFHAALASSSAVAPYLWTGKLVKVPAVVDLIDVDSQKWFDYADASSFPKSWLYRLEGRRVRLAEQGILSWARSAVLVSEGEAALLRSGVPSDRIRVAANGVDLDFFEPEISPQAGEGCIFTGAMDYRPNVDAVVWFANEVWPQVRIAHPECRFRVVGRNPARAVRRLAGVRGIEVTGAVAVVRPYLRDAAVAVAPLRIARGLQNKVLEALAMAKPVVASPAALAGFRHDVPAVHAESPADWVEQITHLLGDPDERRLLGGMGREFAERLHDWNRCLEPFRELLGLRGVAQAAKSEWAIAQLS